MHLSEKHDSFFAVQAERKPMVTLFLLFHAKSLKEGGVFYIWFNSFVSTKATTSFQM